MQSVESAEWPEVALDLSVGLAGRAGAGVVRAGDHLLVWSAAVVGLVAGAFQALTPDSTQRALASWLDEVLQEGRDRREAMSAESAAAAHTLAMRVAATDTVRTVVLSVVEDAMDEILERAVPSTLAAIEQPEIVAHLDEVMRDLLLRIVPDVLERTLPTSMVRATTRAPSDLVPMLRAAAASTASAVRVPGQGAR